jgi:hypothetical protein
MLLGLSKVAKKTFRAHETLVAGLQQYFGDGSYLDGAGTTKTRYGFNAKNDIPVPDIARFELVGAIALLTNIVSTCFWIVYQV